MVTQLFIDTSDYLHDDVASAVKDELIVHPEPTGEGDELGFQLRLRAGARSARRRSRATSMSSLKIAVVGGGIGGPGPRARLARARDQAARSTSRQGAARGRRGGRAVGQREPASRGDSDSGDQLESVSVVPSALVVRRWDTGAIIADRPMGRGGVYEATFGAPYYGVRRVALLQALADRLGGEGLNLGCRCVAAQEHRWGAELQFADGTSAAADVVVGADGVRSVIRRHVAPEARGRFSGTVGYRGLVAVAEQCPGCLTRRRFGSGRATGRRLLRYAIDGGRNGVDFLAVVRVPEWTNDAWMEQCCHQRRRRCVRPAGIAAVTEMVGATDVGERWALHDLRPLRALAHRPCRADGRRRSHDESPIRDRAPTRRSRTRSRSPTVWPTLAAPRI